MQIQCKPHSRLIMMIYHDSLLTCCRNEREKSHHVPTVLIGGGLFVWSSAWANLPSMQVCIHSFKRRPVVVSSAFLLLSTWEPASHRASHEGILMPNYPSLKRGFGNQRVMHISFTLNAMEQASSKPQSMIKSKWYYHCRLSKACPMLENKRQHTTRPRAAVHRHIWWSPCSSKNISTTFLIQLTFSFHTYSRHWNVFTQSISR